MASDICILCWKKDATEVFVSGKVRVCRGCKYEVDRVLNFMQYFGCRVVMIEHDDPPLHPKPPTPKKPAEGSPKHAKELDEAKERARDRQGTLDMGSEGN